MSYYFSKMLETDMDDAIARTIKALSNEGFGVLTEIDIQATLKKKLGADFKPYRILGACNPGFAYKALTTEDKVGTMLPCNVILHEVAPGAVEVSAVNPIASMSAIQNQDLEEIALQVRDKLRNVIEAL